MIKELMRLLEALYHNRHKEVYIWGAGAFGKNLVRFYLDKEIRITGFIDSSEEKHGKTVCGLSVYSPDVLTEENKDSIFIILAGLSEAFYFEVRDVLIGKGFAEGLHFLDFARFRLPEKWTGHNKIQQIEANVLNNSDKNHKFYKAIHSHSKKLAKEEGRYDQLAHILDFDLLQSEYSDMFFPSFDLPITLKCSLNCLGCSACVPFIDAPTHFTDISQIVEDLTKITFVSYIFRMNILGGEPFMHPQLKEIMNNLLQLDNIGLFEIITNGTIIPGSEMIEFLSLNPRITVRISSFPISYDKAERLADIMKKNNVSHYLEGSIDGSWYNLGEFHNRNYDKKTADHLFLLCESTTCNSLVDGRLFVCPRISVPNYIGAIPDNLCDYIDIRNLSAEVIKEKLADFFQNNTAYPGCYYCNGGYAEGLMLRKAEQIPRKDNKKKGRR